MATPRDPTDGTRDLPDADEVRVRREHGEAGVGGRDGGDRRDRGGLLGFVFSAKGWPYVLVPLIPIAAVLGFVVHADATLLFVTSALGVIPAAALTGRATVELAERAGPGIGGFLNVTFGNLPELVIAFIALNAGLYEVVKAWVIGSVLGNVLLVLGISMLVGGIRHREQKFESRAAFPQSMMLFVTGVALLLPAILFVNGGGSLPLPGQEGTVFTDDIRLASLLIALVMLGAYAGGLIFSLRTHQDLFNPEAETGAYIDAGRKPWSARKAILLLAIAGVAVGLMAEILVESLSETAERAGVSEFFISVIVAAVVGNSAEHWVAVLVAHRNKMNLAVNISIGSAAQVALFVAPLLVVLSFFFGPAPMPLVFNALEIAGVLLAVFIAGYVSRTGESTWFEGLLLVAVYLVFGITFFFA